MKEERYVRFVLRGIAVDGKSKAPVLLLQDPGGRIVLPIWIGPFEARAIAAHLEGKRFNRPMSHDLMRTLIETLGAEVVGLDIRGLDSGTFFASLRIKDEHGHVNVVDCRPSDGVAVAIRTGAEIRVSTEVMAAAQALPQNSENDAPRLIVVPADDVALRQKLLEDFAEMEPGDFEHEM